MYRQSTLQFLPLIEHKRFGSLSYRGYMIAKGELQPREGEARCAGLSFAPRGQPALGVRACAMGLRLGVT